MNNFTMTMLMPECGDTVRMDLRSDTNGYTLHTPDWTLSMPDDVTVRDTVESVQAVHMMLEHRA